MMTNRARRIFAGLSALFWGAQAVIPTAAYAADSFAAGKAMGNAQVQSGAMPSAGSLSSLPGYDSNTNYNAIGEQYFKSGRTSLSDLGTIYDAGTTVKNESSTCTEGDNACSARNLTSKKYSLNSPSNPYKQDALNMRAGIDKDPLSVLGIGVPNQNGGSVCVESETDLPPTEEERTCLETQWKTLNVISKLPTTTTVDLSNPTCVDPTYTLSADGSVCEKTVYSCPQGGELNGTGCVKTTTPTGGGVGCNSQVVNMWSPWPSRVANTDFSNLSSGKVNIEYYRRPPTWPGFPYTVEVDMNISDISRIAKFNIRPTRITPRNGRFGIIIDFNGNGVASSWGPGYTYFDYDKWTSESYGYFVFVADGPGRRPGYLEYSDNSFFTNKPSINLIPYLKQGFNYLRISTASDESGPTDLAFEIEFETKPCSPTCPAGYTLNDSTCTMNYPATATYLEATPGCLGGQTLTRSDQLVQAGCSVLSGGAWQSKASRSLTTTDVLNQYIDINLSCNFDATDANQFIGLDNFTGVTGLYVDRVTVTPSDGSPTRIIKAEERTATNAIPLNVVNDPTASDGMAHYATQASSHVKSRAWGLHASDVGLPRFSDIPATVTIRIRSDHINEQTATDPGTVLCSSQQYTCPAGQVLNGYVCEDVDRQDYLANPNCVNLGYDPDTESEAFYCTEQKLDECIEMPADCTLVNSACVYNDEVPGSPTPGACLATEKTYTCPVPGKTVSKVSCGYDPMCYNGNCFTPPDGQCQGVTEEVTKTRISSCFEHREQTIGQCSLTVTKDPYGGNQTYTLGTDCQQYVDNPQCVQVPVLTDDEGNYPTTTAFSCLGDPVNDCDRIMADTACDTANPTRTCVDYEDMNGSNGRCVHTQLDYTCTDTLTMPGDECTQDLSKVLISMEAGRQAGNYMDINEMRLFKGEYSRCDRRAASFLGAGIGSKSCCNVRAPDPKNNSDVMTSQVMSVGGQFLQYGAQKSSAYMYDYMMNSEAYANAAMDAWSSGFISDSAANSLMEGAGTSATASNISFEPGISYAGLALSYTGTAAAAGTTAVTTGTTLGVQYTTYSVSLGGGMQLAFTPVMFYVWAAIQLYSMYQEALACDEQDYMTATKNKASLCYKTHTYCAKKDCGIFGCTCTKYRTAQCCYNSRLAKLINQQGKAQLGISGESDKCDGFTVEQIQNLDWSKIDLSEFVAELLTQAQKGIPTAADLQGVTNRVSGNVSSDGVQRDYNYTP